MLLKEKRPALSASGHHAGDDAAHPKPRADHRQCWRSAVRCTCVFTNLLIAAALAVLVALLLVMTPVGDMLLARFEELGTQSGLRLGIWHHTLSEMASQPWLGRGFSYELDFINYSGEAHHHHPQCVWAPC